MFVFCLNASIPNPLTATPPMLGGIRKITGFVPVIVVIMPVPVLNPKL